MHQDGLFIRVNVELDDISVTTAVQELITCEETEIETFFKTLQPHKTYLIHTYRKQFRLTLFQNNNK